MWVRDNFTISTRRKKSGHLNLNVRETILIIARIKKVNNTDSSRSGHGRKLAHKDHNVLVKDHHVSVKVHEALVKIRPGLVKN